MISGYVAIGLMLVLVLVLELSTSRYFAKIAPSINPAMDS